MLLERKIIDFALDTSFGKISKKMKEHYNIDVPISSCQKITKQHGKRITEASLVKPSDKKESCIIAECDGVIVPIVKISRVFLFFFRNCCCDSNFFNTSLVRD